ncbi:spore protease YyaC [Bacillus sp. JCM 19041]|uniref:spore protease YyaC n=1 Tax=Bacillus sp. JCM 19041 TaxID=1460637 RepID=UPI0006D033D0
MSTNLWPFKKRRPPLRFHIEDVELIDQLGKALLSHCDRRGKRDLLLLCIGTDRSTGDALGPLLGSLLKNTELTHFHVYGTLAEPIHATNMEERLTEIYEKHSHAYTVAVDACLGRSTNVGYVTLNEEPLKPGAAMGKNLPEIGDICLTGIVNVGGLMDFYMLQSTRLHVVMNMAEKLTALIQQVDTCLSVSQKPQKAFRLLAPKNELL